MKPSVSPHVVASLLVGTLAPISAQNLPAADSIRSGKFGELSGQIERRFVSAPVQSYDIAPKEKALNEPNPESGLYATQDGKTLSPSMNTRNDVDTIVDLGILKNPSPFRTMAVRAASGQPYEGSHEGLQSGLAELSAIYREVGKSSDAEDCPAVMLSVEQRVKLDVSKVLEIVESEIGANPSCACEVVKAAIKASEADVERVVAIVETAINTSPDQMRIISQCAIAAMPESVAAVQALLSKLDPNSGDAGAYSSKSAKSAKSAKAVVVAKPPLPNPLDLPPFPPIVPPIVPPIIIPPVTQVDPCP